MNKNLTMNDVNITPSINHKIILDIIPSQRWLNLIELYKNQILQVLEKFEKLIDEKIFSRKLLEFAISMNSSLWAFPYYEELLGVSKTLGISFAKTLLLQGYYEIFQSSTTILMNKPMGKTNDLDFEEASMCNDPPISHIHFMESQLSMLADMTINVNFYSKGKIVYRATTYPGYIGVMLGSRSNMGSVVYSNRYMKSNHYSNISRLAWGHMPTGFLIRNVMEDETIKSYSSLCGRLRQSGTMAPAYISVTGKSNNEGTIMYRNPELTHERGFPPHNQAEMDYTEIEANQNNENQCQVVSKYVPVLVIVNIDTPYLQHIEGLKDMDVSDMSSSTILNSIWNTNGTDTLWGKLSNLDYNNERYDMALYKSYDLYDAMTHEHLSTAFGSEYITNNIKKYLDFPILNNRTSFGTWIETGRNIHYTINISNSKNTDKI